MAHRIVNVYKSLDDVMDVLTNDENSSLPEIQELITIYNNRRSLSKLPKHVKPLILLEGLDGSGKTTIMNELNKRINCQMITTPPESLKGLRPFFDNKPPALRRAFYSLGNYIIGEEIKEMLRDSTVILDRFWPSTCAFALATEAVNGSGLPPETSDVYKWPEDLIKPSLAVFLQCPETLRLQRLSRRSTHSFEEEKMKNDHIFRKHVVAAYSRVREPALIRLNCIKPPYKVAQDVLYLLKGVRGN